MRKIDETLSLVCKFLNKENIDYVLVGGLAVNFHGVPRTTMDIDIILNIGEGRIPKLVNFLIQNDFLADAEDIEDALRESSHCTIHDKRSMIRLDIKGVYGEMDRRTLERRRSFEYGGIKIQIASPEDTIASKLLFGSEQDLKDAEGIYIRQHEKLDMEYLEETCKELGVGGEFKYLKKRVEETNRGGD
ncbi:hypothetical protein AKJ45_02220 [candidate division MSBL1 archaeon SCGC-AAA261F19]|uniref:DUF6036 domain-containing protein n=1 Tax=candidate division MSBL1 archaeon SCGC-AAA261F19 TaxID=1698275 RepID=A0A133V9R8_9EURY|nr:hypothetical protein AKJ45_02220 [candidate division MSBL1 archaeon SCGC-AAA261F19]